MSPAQDILDRMGFINIGPLKGAPGMDLWEYCEGGNTVHAAIPRTPDAGVSWAVQALVEAGASRQRNISGQAYQTFLNTFKLPPGVPIQPNEPA